MPQYDGSIRINTEIDAKNVNSQMMQVVNSIRKAEAEVSRLQAKMREMERTNVPTGQYADLQKELSDLTKEQEKLNEEMKEFDGVSNKANLPLYKDLYFQADAVNKKIEFTKQLMKGLEDSGKAYEPSKVDTEEYARAAEKVRELNGNIEVSKQRLSELRAKQEPVTKGFERAKSIASKLASALGIVKNVGFKAFSGIKSAAQKAFSVISKAFSSIVSGSKSGSSALSGFSSRLKNLAKTVLVFNLIRQALNAMVSTAKEGVTNFSNYSSDFANSVQNIKNSVSQIGNQIAAAFAPIIQMVIPWLQRLVDAISTAMSYVAQFIALLTGKSTFTRAKKVQDSYNKSLGGTASAAKKAYGALAKFDDLDVLQKKEDESGGGAGIVDPDSLFEEVPISDKMKDFFDWLKDMWENADFYDLGKLLGEKLKEALENIPWDEIKEVARKLGKSLASLINGFIEVEELGYMIGYTLAQAFNTGFEFLNEFVHELHWDSIGKFIAETLNGVFETIDWALIRDTFVTGAKGLADAINSFNDWFNWENISNTISNGLNTITETIFTFFDTVDWSILGHNIGNQIAQTIKKIDWSQAGEAFSTAAKSMFDFLLSALEEIDWGQIGTSIRDFLMAIDWSGLFQSVGDIISETLNGLIHTAYAALGGNDEEFTKWQEENRRKRDEASKEYDEWYDKMSTGFKNWQQNNRETRDAEREAFGTWFDDLKEKFISWQEENRTNRDNAKAEYDSWFNDLETKFKSWQADNREKREVESEAFSVWIEDISTRLTEGWEYIKESAATIWESIKQFLSETWTTIQTNATTIYTAIKTFLQTTWENIKATATTVWNAIKTFLQTTWTNMQNLAVSIWTAIKNWFFETWQAIKEKALEIWENVRAVFEEKFNAIKEKTQEIINKFNEFRSNVSEVFHNIRDTISETIGSAIGKLSDFISKIREAIEAIKDFLASGFEKVSGFVGGLFGGGGSGRSAAPAARAMAYTMPEIPALASGAVIRGGDPFLAFLGDQPRGQTNIEAPLATIERAVENAMSRNGYGNERVPVNINLQYDGETFARLSLDDILSEANRRGFDVSILGVT